MESLQSPSPATLDPALSSSTPNHNNWPGPDDSPAMARHSYITRSPTSASHARHQSVPAIPSPQHSGHERQSSSRGLAKLTLVERLSRESIPSPDSACAASPRSLSPVRFEEGSPRLSHSPRKNRMSLSIPATKTGATSVTASPMSSPLRTNPLAPTAPMNLPNHVSTGSLSEINLSPSPHVHERAMTSPTLSSFEEVAALDDANATFLTLIAFQERRVVELREELARAESELDFLKQQWTRQQLKLTRTARQEHVRQNSITKLEQQFSAAPRTSEDGGQFKSPQILAAGKRLAEGVRDGLYGMMEDLKSAAVNESAQATPRQRARSPTRGQRGDVGLGIVEAKSEDPPLWIPKQRSSPMKRNISGESDDTDATNDTTSISSMYPLHSIRADAKDPREPPQSVPTHPISSPHQC